ncbi:phytoene/squalene synthase family protein [soil metagenome]
MSVESESGELPETFESRIEALGNAVSIESVSKVHWQVCSDITRRNGRTFYFASQLLPPQARRAVHAVYAYCRIADDYADRVAEGGVDWARCQLAAWEAGLDQPVHDVAIAFSAVRHHYAIDSTLARDLLSGVQSDLESRRFDDWDTLRYYCYQVAGTVGLMVAPILGCGPTGLYRAEAMGIGMQLTNIIRDVGEDAAMGRVYLPDEDLYRFGVDRDELLRGNVTGDFEGLLAFEIARARALYQEAEVGVPSLSPWAQFAVLASAKLYGQILDRVEAQGFDVMNMRAHVTTSRKVASMPRVAVSLAAIQARSRLGGLS